MMTECRWMHVQFVTLSSHPYQPPFPRPTSLLFYSLLLSQSFVISFPHLLLSRHFAIMSLSLSHRTRSKATLDAFRSTATRTIRRTTKLYHYKDSLRKS